MDTQGKRTRGILGLAAPLVVSFWFRSTFQWVDTFYASLLEGVGDASIAAIGLTLPFEFLMVACWVGTSNGLTSRLSAAMGARQGARIEQLLRATKRIVIVLWLVFLLVAAGVWFGATRVGLDPVVARQFQVYGTVLLGGSGFTAFWSILPDSIVKAHHDTRSTMWAGILSTSLNVVLNTIFVFVFHWGIFGIALSTVLGRLAGLAYALCMAARLERARKAAQEDVDPTLYERPVRSILALSAPAGASYILLAGEGLAVNAMLAATSDPTTALAAWSIFDRAARFCVMPAIASSVAMLPLSARLFGAGEHGRIREELRTLRLATTAYVLLVVTPLALFGGPWLARALSESPVTSQRAARCLLLVPLAVLFMAPMFQLRSTFEGMQRPRPGLFASAVRALLLVIPLVWLGLRLAPTLGQDELVGACAGFTLGAGLGSCTLWWWFRRSATGD